ncbi:MAG: GGDEF domain-containing protein [Jatrophihabitantaceae bacterium]
MLSAPRRLVGYLLVIEVAAFVGMLAALANAHWNGTAAAKTAMIFVLALAFEECTRNFGTIRIKLGEHLKADMTSVWSFAAAITLPAAYTVVLVPALMGYRWLRVQRPAGELGYRKFGAAATVLLGCLAAHATTHDLKLTAPTPSAGLGDALTVLVALIIYTLVARVLITGAVLLLGARGQDLIGSRDDNLIELSTLCLGGLTALAVLHEPWLTVLVLLPMSLLQRSAVVKQLEIVATTDAKTGLWTAVAWEELSQRELARAKRNDQPVAVLMLDIDRFKAVNDNFGHMVGDVVLAAVGHHLKTELRGYDLVARLGGEEFVALLPGVDEPTALAIAERLRARLAEISLLGYQQLESAQTQAQANVTVSIGVACSAMHGGELPELMHASDAALYAAKHAGRNRVLLGRTRSRTVETEDITVRD